MSNDPAADCHEPEPPLADAQTLRSELTREIGERRRAQCLADIQSYAVQLSLDLIAKAPDIEGFLGAFTKSIADECESHACGVWLIDEDREGCELAMAYLRDRRNERPFPRELAGSVDPPATPSTPGDHLYTPKSPDWPSLALPRESMAAHLFAFDCGWRETVEYDGDDGRLPEAVRAYNRDTGIATIAVTPLHLGERTLGWIALASWDRPECESKWRVAVLEAMAKQITLALHHHHMAERTRREERRKAILEERNRLARDIHDNLAQGFAAILMQVQAARREGGSLPPSISGTLDATMELARTHLAEARRSVGALRPNAGTEEDVATALKRIADLARRTGNVPIELAIDELPRFGTGVEREVIGIAQEALTNAVKHARADRITIRASAVRSLGLRLSIADNGRGFAGDRVTNGFGMTSMRERAERIGASLTIVTAPRNGTEVVLAWDPASLPMQVHAAQ